MPSPPNSPVLITGATGFVGRNLCPVLQAAGYEVVAASRDPVRAAKAAPRWRWVRLDVDQPATLAPALEGVRAVVYLVHSLSAGADYAEREAIAATAFREAAAAAGLRRIVYLGGVSPRGVPSRHLWSRLKTGELLRAGSVPTVELRASMIVGHGSLSWKIVRDLAARLPIMLMPRWVTGRSQPVGIDDVAFAIRAALELPIGHSTSFDLPGPEVLRAGEILQRIAALRGTRPITIPVSVISQRLSGYWLRIVSRADPRVARELIAGLTTDLLPTGPLLWDRIPAYERTGFDEAARRALVGEEGELSLGARLVEGIVRRVALRPLAPGESHPPESP